MILRVNKTNSYTAKACCVMYLGSRNTRVKQSNDVRVWAVGNYCMVVCGDL